MAEYRTIKSKEFWTAPYIESLNCGGKLLYLYFTTGPLTNNLGIINASVRRIAYETAMEIHVVEELLQKFEADNKIIRDRDSNLIFVKNFIEHQTSTSPKIMAGLKKLVQEIKSSIILNALFIRYPYLFENRRYPMDTLSIPLPELEREREMEREEEEPPIAPHGGAGERPAPDPLFAQIGEEYHRALPELPRYGIWSSKDARNLKLNIEAFPERAAIGFWAELFGVAAKCPHLLGKSGRARGQPWKASLPWLLEMDNNANVLNGKYLPGETPAGQSAGQKTYEALKDEVWE
jgi:hypothetical protein